MTYTAWSVVFGEQPSASKWNQLGTNDASFNDGTGISNLEIGSGHISLKNDHKFSVYDNTGAALTTNTWTKVTLNTEEFDTGGNFDSVTNFRFTAPVAGFYLFSGTVLVGTAGLTSGTYGLCAFRKNGSDYRYSQRIVGNGTSNIFAAPNITAVIQLAANDYIELWAFTSDTGRNIGSGSLNTYMSGCLISQT